MEPDTGNKTTGNEKKNRDDHFYLGRYTRLPPDEHLHLELAPAAGGARHRPPRRPLPRNQKHDEGIHPDQINMAVVRYTVHWYTGQATFYK